MSKLYNLVYHFKDGNKWAEEGNEQSAEGIAFLLNHFQTSDNLEVTSLSTKETRKVSEIKSIEIIL